MANNTIEHSGIVESIHGTILSVRIVQTSACAACSAKGFCSSADSKDKVVDVTDAVAAASCRVGDQVIVMGETSLGLAAVGLAFVVPFLLLVVSLFLWMALTGDELRSALLSLAILIPYYYLLWLNRKRLKHRFSFSIKSIN